jgi:2-polyprenyl-3-methyl-5-hydroxy-6-metoxy-1,4-benzoquinol methylase
MTGESNPRNREWEHETRETWNKVAELYAEKFMDMEIYNATYDAVLRILPHSAKVLDIGCGPGNISRYFLKKRPDLKVFGIDSAPNMIAVAKKNTPEARFEIMEADAISKIEERFDAIICGFVIPYLDIRQCADLIADCSRMLNPQGILYISFVEGEPSSSGYQTGSTGDRVFFHYYAPRSLSEMLTQGGITTSEAFRMPFLRSNGIEELHHVILGRQVVF